MASFHFNKKANFVMRYTYFDPLQNEPEPLYTFHSYRPRQHSKLVTT